MKKLIFALFLVIITSVFAFAQNSDDYKKYEFFAGFSNGQVDNNFDSGSTVNSFLRDRSSFNGFNVSGVYNVHRYIGIKADFSGTYRKDHISVPVITGPGPTVQTFSYDSTSALYNFLGGIQIKDNASQKRFKPFAHVLAGAAHQRFDVNNVSCPSVFNCSGLGGGRTGFAGAVGGGLDIKINERLDFRAFQVDYNPTRIGGRFDHNVRIGFGIVFK